VKFKFVGNDIAKTIQRDIKSAIFVNLSDSLGPEAYFATIHGIKAPIELQVEDVVIIMRYQAISISGGHEL
jgi:hypothetical protein